MSHDIKHIFIKGSLQFGRRIENFLESGNNEVSFNIIKLVPSNLSDRLNNNLSEDIKMIKNVLNLHAFVYIREYDETYLIEKVLKKTQFNELLIKASKDEENLLLKWYIQDKEDVNEIYYFRLEIPELMENFSFDEHDFTLLKNLFKKRINDKNLMTVYGDLRFEAIGVDKNSIQYVTENNPLEFFRIIELFFNKNDSKYLEKQKKEFESHLEFCNFKVQNFIGRSNNIITLIEIFRKRSPEPLIIHGRSGCGKTTMMAYIATNLKVWTQEFDKEVKIILRFIGISNESNSIQNISISIMKEIKEEYGVEYDQEKAAPEYLFIYLTTVAKKFPKTEFYLLLDSLDQLANEKEARKLSWFPHEIRCPNLKIVVSTLREAEYEVFPALFNMFSSTPEIFLSLGEFEASDIEELISKKFKTNDEENNRLSQLRIDFVKEASKISCIPIYLKMIIDIALTFNSFSKFENDLNDISPELSIKRLFEKAENMISDVDFVIHALTFITISRFGLRFEHLQRLMLNNYTCPEYNLIKLINYLSEYLIFPQCRWYHRLFFEVANQRYNPIKEISKDYHYLIYKTFKTDRCIEKFWISEIPYHLTLSSKKLNELKDKFLLNLNFMDTKIKIMDIDALVNDFSHTVKEYPNEFIFEILYRTLLMAAYKLRARPTELAGQLYGRMQGLYDENLDMKKLLKSCTTPDRPSIIPNKRFMAFATRLNQGEPILLHKDEISTIGFTPDFQTLVSCQTDKTVNIFFAQKDFKFKLNYVKKGFETRHVTISSDSTIVYFWAKNSDPENLEEIIIEAFDLENKIFLFEFKAKLLDDMVRAKAVFFSSNDSKLWLTTKNYWYFINWKNGIVENKRKFPEIFSKYQEKVISRLAFGQYNDVIALGFDDDSKIMICKNNYIHDKVYCLGEDKIIGGRFAILSSNKIAISVRRMYESKFGDQDFEWHILIHDLETFDQNFKIPLNKAVCIWHSCFDSRTLFCYTYNYIYVLDIFDKETKMTLEHSSQINCCVQRYGSEILCATFDRKMTFWDLNKTFDPKQQKQQLKEIENINIFSNKNSRMIRFLANSQNDTSRYVLVYNFYDDDSTEMFLVFDIEKQEIVRKCRLVGYNRNDLRPIIFISNYTILVYCESKNLYYLLLIDSFKIPIQLKAAKTRVCRKINEFEIILSVETSNSSVLVSYQNNFTKYVNLVKNWENVEIYTLNDTKIIYKNRNESLFYLNDFQSHQTYKISSPIELVENLEIIISPQSSYFIIVKENGDNPTKTVLVYSLKSNFDTYILNKEAELTLPKLTLKMKSKCLPIVQFINDNILLYQYKQDYDRITRVFDISAKNNYLWFKDDDSDLNTLGLFDCLKHENSSFIWYHRYQVSRYNRVTNDIIVFCLNDLSKPLAVLDADCRLKINQSALFDRGNCLLVKELDKLQFVIFQVKSIERENIIIFNDHEMKKNSEIFEINA